MKARITLELSGLVQGAPKEGTRNEQKSYLDIPEATPDELRTVLPQMFEQMVADAFGSEEESG